MPSTEHLNLTSLYAREGCTARIGLGAQPRIGLGAQPRLVECQPQANGPVQMACLALKFVL